MSNFPFWQRWLFIVGIGIAVFGILLAVLSVIPLLDLLNRQIDPVFWGTEPSLESTKRFQQWIYGVWGATIAGWGVFVAFIAHYPFRNKEKWAWNCRVYFNAVFNTALLILAGLPVVFTRKEFAQMHAAKHTPTASARNA